MMVKIDTREKFHVITFPESETAANMTEKMEELVMPLLEDNVKNVIINMKDIKIVDIAAANRILHLQKMFNNSNASFVLCGIQPEVKKSLADSGHLDQLNHTPTESEAMDIVQMEEIEREFDES